YCVLDVPYNWNFTLSTTGNEQLFNAITEWFKSLTGKHFPKV
ncbi:MAG: hypothetical protein ACI9DJ_001552, partial [Algoriphagus sp.]